MEQSPDQLSCSLSTDELGDRASAWKRMGTMLVDGVRTDDGFRVRFRSAPGVSDSIRTLAAAERDCCGWATWAVTDTEDHCVLDVTGPVDKIEPLATAFGVAT